MAAAWLVCLLISGPAWAEVPAITRLAPAEPAVATRAQLAEQPSRRQAAQLAADAAQQGQLTYRN